MKIVERYVVDVNGEQLRRIINGRSDVSHVTFMRVFRLRDEGDTWVEVRISNNLYVRLCDEDGWDRVLNANIAVREPLPHERKPFKKVITVDIYERSQPEEVLKFLREELDLCEDWTRRVTKLFAVGQKPSEVISRLKRLIVELEGSESTEE